MKKIIQYTQVVPIILITFYVGFYFFIDFQVYANLHYNYLEPIDNIFVIISLIVFSLGGYKSWNKIAIKSFWTIMLLNLINIIPIENYYLTYSLIVQLFLITIILTQIPKKIRWN